MNTRTDPTELAASILRRSSCAVQVAAVLADDEGVFAWGWNSAGPTGYGLHAEAHCIGRANPRRLPRATMWVAARRRKSGNVITARPCVACQLQLQFGGVRCVIYRDGEGKWRRMSPIS